jgi:4-aminobutyrate aminotransferase / (S)-3-amino-2-methylpropionate transaminase / 5-aminovalerate transaminase
MGLYRTGRLWGFENYDIVPDAFTFGKSISNGIWPLSGVWAKEALISPDVWPAGSTHATYLGHPLGTRLGLDVMNYIETTSFLTEEQESRQNLHRIIESLSKDYEIIGNVQTLGHAANIELVRRHSKHPAPDLAKAIVDMALTKPLSIDGKNYGLILTIGGFFSNVITLSPYLQMSIEDWHLFSRLIRHFLNQAETLAE